MSQEPTIPSKERILVVDDTPVNLTLLTRMLSRQGYQVQIASSGKQALISAQSAPPDLILLDILMPETDGYKVCQQLKGDERTKDIPVIFLSALNEVFDKVKAFSIGGVDYISKPFQMQELLARVENQLHIRRLSKKLTEENARLQQEIREKEAVARQRQQVEAALWQSAVKLRHQNLALTELARNKALNQGNLEAALKEITQATAQNVAVERVSVWLFDETSTKLRCLDLFELSLNRHSQGLELTTRDYPAYFQALTQESVIVADNAHTDPRTREFSQVYLTPLGISSMLDAPIRLGEQAVGVLCNEHVGAARHWMPEDQNFARSAADLVSLALQARERQRAESALRESEEKFSKAFRSSPDAISITTLTDGRYIEVNDSFCRLFGYSRLEVMDHTTSELNLWVNSDEPARLMQLLREQGVVRNLEVDFCTRSGEVRTGLLSAEVVDIGCESCVLSISKDITNRKRIEQERSELIASLQKSEASLAEAQRVAHVGSWEFDVFSGKFTWSEELFRIFGLDSTEPEPTYPQLIDKIHPDDRVVFQQTIEQALASGLFHEFDLRILRPDSGALTTLGASGSIQHIEVRGETVLNDTAQVIRLFGTALDITARKQAEEALRESAKREQAIARVIQRIRQTLDIDTIFSATTEELRQLLECDRVAIYRFNPDWSGEFVSESVASGWISLIATQHADSYLKDGFLGNGNCVVKTLNLEQESVQDTYLQATQGGAYSKGTSYLYAEDIYNAGFNPCYISLLERFQIRAYITVPIFCGSKLWGLLASYQNSASRQWEAAEINIVVQIGTQLGVALQQAELLEETQRQAAQLWEAKDTAEVANRAKSQFLANMSHELRTPLNAILGFTQILNRDSSLSDEQREHLGIIMRSGEHLLELINDILEMSKIEAGRTILNETSVDLFRLLDNLQEMLQIKAQAKSLQLIFERTPEVPQYVIADEGKLRQVLINLLGNALKFTQKGRVMLRVGVRDGEGIENSSHSQFSIPSVCLPSTGNEFPRPASPDAYLDFEVSDTGPGIAQEEIDSLFTPFAQTATGQQSNEGTGLGLSICRSFVQLMGGNITVNSTLGEGATFKFDILLKLASSSDIQTDQSIGHVIGVAPEQGEYRILVVEDKWTNRLLLVKLLKSVGFQVCEAENGQEAIALWLSWKPHLIFMDMQMPVMDGYEATRQIRKAESKRRLALDKPLHTSTIIIALTASAFEEQRAIILSVGCDDFIRKPFRENVLFDAIARYLGVRYLYEAQEQSSMSETFISPSALTREALDIMPTEWVQELYQAAVSMDDQRIMELSEQIPQSQTTLASTLRNLVDNFRLDVIIDCLEAGQAPTDDD